MRVSRIQAEENRQTVINAASRLFRQHGFEGIGLAGLMKAAGLTPGGFYKQFKSKDDLIAQACGRALDEGKGKWASIVAAATDRPLAALVRFYLSACHRRHIGDGCALAALAPDVARGGPALRRTFEAGIEAYLQILDQASSERLDAPDATVRDGSVAALATMVGALVLSRAIEDQALAQRFLNVAAEAVIARHRGDESAGRPPQ